MFILLVLMLMLKSRVFSLAYARACAYAYACAYTLVKTSLNFAVEIYSTFSLFLKQKNLTDLSTLM